MTAPIVYASTDASAPTLNGQAGSLVTVLDAILVTGYGAQLPAGWAIAFTGTNKRIYRAPTGALRGFFRVQDDSPSPTLAAGREALLRGSEAASAIDTQTNLFPTAAQLASGLFIRKSAYADATAVPWIAVADDRTLYFFCNVKDYPGWAAFMIGEYFSLKPTADAYNGMVIGRNASQVAATPTALATQEGLHLLSAITAVTGGHYLARSFSEFMASAVNVGKHGNAAHSAATLVGLTDYPNPVDSTLHLSQVWVHEPAANPIIRGRLRGFWHFLHPVGSPVNHLDTWSGSGSLAGKTFMAIKPTPDGLGMFVIETSNTWETN